MLCENPKTNVAAKNSWKSRGKFKNLFLVRVITDIMPQNMLRKQFRRKLKMHYILRCAGLFDLQILLHYVLKI